MKIHSTTTFFFGIITAIIAIYTATILLAPAPAQAELIPACSASGACGVCDIIGVFITLGKWLVVGGAGLALLVIINAGVTLAMSAGNPEKVGAGKKQILGAVIGLGAVLIAFEFVSLIVFLVVTPSSLQTFEAGQAGTAANKKQGERASLISFLGIPWWNICNQEELIAKGGKGTGASTANCQYWGDDTACGANAICCKGKCEPGMKPARKGPDGKDIPSDCPLYTQVSATRPGLATSEQAKEDLDKIGALALGSGSCIGLNTQDENSVQDCLKKAGINVTFINYRTTVAGLSRQTIDKLMQASAYCDFKCITITGGTEKAGHSAGTSHGKDNVVDIDVSPQNVNTVINALKSVGLQQVERFPGTPGGWFICDESGKATGCNVASHVHVQF